MSWPGTWIMEHVPVVGKPGACPRRQEVDTPQAPEEEVSLRSSARRNPGPKRQRDPPCKISHHHRPSRIEFAGGNLRLDTLLADAPFCPLFSLWDCLQGQCLKRIQEP